MQAGAAGRRGAPTQAARPAPSAAPAPAPAPTRPGPCVPAGAPVPARPPHAPGATARRPPEAISRLTGPAGADGPGELELRLEGDRAPREPAASTPQPAPFGPLPEAITRRDTAF